MIAAYKASGRIIAQNTQTPRLTTTERLTRRQPPQELPFAGSSTDASARRAGRHGKMRAPRTLGACPDCDVVPVGFGIFGIDGQYDTVRATFTDGGNAPRIPPQRWASGAYWRNDNWFVRTGPPARLPAIRPCSVRDPAGYNLLKAELVHKRFWKYSPWGRLRCTDQSVASLARS